MNRLVQNVERLIRPHPATATVHDYHDELTPVLAALLRKRAPGYTKLVVTSVSSSGVITHEVTRDQTVQQGYAVATVKPEEIAEVIAFALARPRHLVINEILLRPASQLN